MIEEVEVPLEDIGREAVLAGPLQVREVIGRAERVVDRLQRPEGLLDAP